MKEIIKGFFSEKDPETGKLIGSSKRWIAITIGAVLAWGIGYAIAKAANATERLSVIIATMSFLLVLLGLATFPQIVSIFRGGNVDDKKE